MNGSSLKLGLILRFDKCNVYLFILFTSLSSLPILAESRLRRPVGLWEPVMLTRHRKKIHMPANEMDLVSLNMAVPVRSMRSGRGQSKDPESQWRLYYFYLPISAESRPARADSTPERAGFAGDEYTPANETADGTTGRRPYET